MKIKSFTILILSILKVSVISSNKNFDIVPTIEFLIIFIEI